MGNLIAKRKRDKERYKELRQNALELGLQDDVDRIGGMKSFSFELKALFLEQAIAHAEALTRNKELLRQEATAHAEALTRNEELLRQEGIAHAEALKELHRQKVTGEYWHRIDQVWKTSTSPKSSFDGSFQHAKKGRQGYENALYAQVRVDLRGEQVDKENLLTYSTAAATDSELMTTVATENSGQNSNRKTNEKHERQHNLNFLGENKKSRAHLLPTGGDCNMFWWPVIDLVSGNEIPQSGYVNPDAALQRFDKLWTNRVVFPNDHNGIFDTLKTGVVCLIPLCEKMDDILGWEFARSYSMLVVCDSANTYKEIGMVGDSFYPHITVATKEDVVQATRLMEHMIRILADSLISNWDDAYKKLQESGGRKAMLEAMRERLLDDNGVAIPEYALEEEPKLYKIDYKALYSSNDEGGKYIPDPLLLLVKSAVNLSATYYSDCSYQWKEENGSWATGKGTKLLPSCSFAVENEEESSVWGTSIVGIDQRQEAVIGKGAVPETISIFDYCSQDRKANFHVVTDTDGSDEEANKIIDDDASDLTQ